MQDRNRLLYVLALVKLVVPFFLQHSSYQPHRDEYLYLAEGHHLSWGYLEVPPLLSVFAWITNQLGAGMFWIKIWPALFGALTFLLVGRIIVSLGGKTFALILGWLPFMLDGYMRLFFLFQPNFLDVFFWTAMGFCLIRYIQNRQARWLYIMGICAGLGMLSKYSAAFYIAALAVGILLTSQRAILTNRHLYLAALVALLLFLPNLVWQYNHNFPVVTHMQTLEEEQLQFIDPVEFLISQLMMNLPCVFIWLAGLYYTTMTAAGKPYRLFAWVYFGVIVLLLVLHGKDYYALGAYPVLFAFGAVQLEAATQYRFRVARYAMLAFSIALGVFAMPLVMPLAKPETLAAYYQSTGLDKTGSFKWEDLEYHPLPQDFADMIGWRETTAKAAAVYNSLPEAERRQTMIYCRGYYTAGALNYYGKDYGLPEVYSDNASFLFWMPDQYAIKHLLLVAHNIPGKDDVVFQQFESMTVKDSLVYPLFRENGIRFILFENGNDSLNVMIERSVAELKNAMRR